ncbi:MAG: LLM class flavin-dependent oxidoreductase [Thermoanaerobaculia bacterium]
MADLAVHLGGHHRSFDDVLALVQRAEALGYRAAYVDGDVSVVPSRGDGPVLDGWTATVALVARTSRIEIGSIRLVHQWNAARLAQAVATAECVAPGRLRFLASIGGQPADRRFGFALPPASERIAWLDEWLAALRRLWAGERVTVQGRYVTLDEALVRPLPRGGRMPIEVGGGAGARLLAVVARHADRWDLNVPPRGCVPGGWPRPDVDRSFDLGVRATRSVRRRGVARGRVPPLALVVPPAARRGSRRGDPRGPRPGLSRANRCDPWRFRHRLAGPRPRRPLATRSRNRTHRPRPRLIRSSDPALC